MSSEIIREYFSKVQEVHATGVATEHSYRPALEWLFDRIETGVTAVNEPKGVSVGRPDFVFQRGVDQLTVGHCEAKDINLGIDPKELKDANKAQFERYTKGLPNLIYTNCLDFHFYKQGECIRKIKIADYLLGLQADESQFEPLWNALRDFTAERLQTITSAEKLAELMAGKAAITKDVLFNTLKEDKDLQSELAGQYEAFKDQLLHDLDIEEFADIYAETIAYGMFGARLHDEVKETFSRTEALEKLPKSNPFLRKLFEFVAGPNLEEGLRRTVDELAEIFQAVDLQKLFKDFGTFTQRNDPFIHFYETFLAKYNPAKRKARGVWYTPEPVVNFIVRAVDDVLKTEFGLSQGLADTSKISVDWDTGTTDKKGKPVTEKKEVHRVQILDPAAGTGTFLAEVIRQIGDRVKDVAPGQWSSYVEKDLIPRLHGFELLMASYAMCHMKLDMMLTSMGYKPSGSPPRLGVYLTNSLEEGERVEQTLPFARWLSEEARGANTVKNDVPVMCVIGNPPYSGESANKGEWIMNLMEAYKKEPGGKQKLQERNPKLINDDYVKFIRLAESMIDKNGEGVLGFITNHGYIDNPTFRGMRWHLLKTFDKIWVLDLHGNAKKKEVAPDGSPDKNVFDIQQGVALIIAVKKKSVEKDKPLAVVLHGDLWGSRQEKYGSLSKLNEKMKFGQFEYRAPYFFFEPFDYTLALAYESGFSISEYFVNLSGVKTGNDADLISLNSTFDKVDSDHIRKIQYRPFDIRFINFDPTLIQRNRISIMRHMMAGENLALNSVRQLSSFDFQHVIAAQDMIDINSVSLQTREQSYIFPLYLYPAEDDLDQSIRVNMDPKIRAEIEAAAMGESNSEVAFKNEGVLENEPDITPRYGNDGRPNEVAIFDYIYGVLHSPDYRETYKEFLKIDFPRIPYPPSPEVFRHVQEKGTQLRRLHLMEDEAIGETPYPFEGEGESIVDMPKYENGGVFINEAQYFANVPELAWNFYIGGYQPAQKWLKDRKDRTLDFDDILHYRKIIKILCETDRIMREIELPLS